LGFRCQAIDGGDRLMKSFDGERIRLEIDIRGENKPEGFLIFCQKGRSGMTSKLEDRQDKGNEEWTVCRRPFFMIHQTL
jgi:hypothetical protein